MSNEEVKKKKEKEYLPKHCEIPFCCEREAISKHHIIPVRDGGSNTRHNIIRLCQNHHWYADRERIPKETLLEIVGKRNEEYAKMYPEDS